MGTVPFPYEALNTTARRTTEPLNKGVLATPHEVIASQEVMGPPSGGTETQRHTVAALGSASLPCPAGSKKILDPQ